MSFTSSKISLMSSGASGSLLACGRWTRGHVDAFAVIVSNLTFLQVITGGWWLPWRRQRLIMAFLKSNLQEQN